MIYYLIALWIVSLPAVYLTIKSDFRFRQEICIKDLSGILALIAAAPGIATITLLMWCGKKADKLLSKTIWRW